MTTYALIIDNVIQAEQGRLPDSARRLDTGQWVLDLPNAHWSRQRATGWWTVTDTTRPADTATTTHDRSVELVDGVPTVVWTQREWTVDELEQRRLAANATLIDQAIAAAIAKLDTLIAAPALGTVPAGTLTTAQLSTALRTLRDGAQATRAGAQDVALILKQTIKLVRGDYDSIT